MTDREFLLSDAAPKGRAYHYVQCGLDNVYLRNGYETEVVDGEEYVSVKDVEKLWKAIGISLAADQRDLSPKELRFLRRHMGLSQEELAKKLQVDVQTVARWEKQQTKISGPANLAIRTLFLTSPVAQPEGGEMVVRLFQYAEDKKKSGDHDLDIMVLIQTHDSWNVTPPKKRAGKR